jgi:transcription-repair coupling factor (superfamily II helicase)
MATRMQEKAKTALTDLPALLDPAEGFAEVAAALRARRSGTVDGAWGSSAALTVAALTREQAGPVLIVLAHPGDLDGWSQDMQSFAGITPTLFPAWDHTTTVQTASDEILGQRLRTLKQIRSPSPPNFILTTLSALLQPVPTATALQQHSKSLRTGTEFSLEELTAWLAAHGFTRKETVELPGEFSRRGGILDVFPLDTDFPCRIEFFGDEISSLRRFSPQTQRSQGEMPAVELTGLMPTAQDHASFNGSSSGRAVPQEYQASLVEHLPASSWIALVEPEDLREQGRHFLERVPDIVGLFSVQGIFQAMTRRPTVVVTSLPTASVEATCHLRVESVERFSGEVQKLREELAAVAGKDRIVIACHNEAERLRLTEVFKPGEDVDLSSLELVVGLVRTGFRLVDKKVVVLSDHELFHKTAAPAQRFAVRQYETRAIDSFLDLAEGDLVVHINHGIGKFLGMQMLDNKGHRAEHLVLEYAEGSKLYVPVNRIDLVQKYVGGAKTEPELSRLGSGSWQKKKEKVQEAVLDLAAEMIDLQARRAAVPGYACPPDTEWQTEFEAAFPYQETQDQLTALTDIKGDLMQGRSMDRLLCGDVGFGKTEVAVRAAFKIVDNGKQVAVLVPTTVLAEQHFRTFGERFAEYPLTAACLSRFRSVAEQKRIVQAVAAGKVDVVIGTHRLLSQDVKFKELGLVIIDEEQRFGVEHKERLKKLRDSVHVLTLTATPIPRTLHLSLLGIRAISNLETPPRDRIAVETRIVRYDAQLIRHAILRELNREGQIYFVHNRVHNIQAVAHELEKIVPEARICIGHGQMAEGELEEAMLKFVRKECDVLVATTIIESGLDIPNANTIFINQADIYGLADLHQLRGRVGRYKHRAYCYLLLDQGKALVPQAAKRLKAIEEFSELGAGFKIAMRDLEIRGAGNILGNAQSGHIAAVGYELYCHLLENAVRKLKQMPPKTVLEVNVDLPWPAFLPRDYVPGQRQKIEVYRRLSRIRKLERLADFRQELIDRFGPVPEQAEWLVRMHEVRLLAARWHIASVHLDEKDIVLGYRNKTRIERLAAISNKRVRVVDEHSAYLRMQTAAEQAPDGMYHLLKMVLQPGK